MYFKIFQAYLLYFSKSDTFFSGMFTTNEFIFILSLLIMLKLSSIQILMHSKYFMIILLKNLEYYILFTFTIIFFLWTWTYRDTIVVLFSYFWFDLFFIWWWAYTTLIYNLRVQNMLLLDVITNWINSSLYWFYQRKVLYWLIVKFRKLDSSTSNYPIS